MGMSCGSLIGRLKFDIYVVFHSLFVGIHRLVLYVVGLVGYCIVYMAVKM